MFLEEERLVSMEHDFLSRGIVEFSSIGAVEIPPLTIGEGRTFSTQNEGGGYNTYIN